MWHFSVTLSTAMSLTLYRRAKLLYFYKTKTADYSPTKRYYSLLNLKEIGNSLIQAANSFFLFTTHRCKEKMKPKLYWAEERRRPCRVMWGGRAVIRVKMTPLRSELVWSNTLENNIQLGCPSERGSFYLSPARREQRNEELTNGPKTVKAVHSGRPAISLSRLAAGSWAYKAWSYRC